MSSLRGQVAIVTGGSRGIGAASSKLLASRGLRIVLSYLKQADRAESLVAEIRKTGGEALAVQSDVREADQRTRDGMMNENDVQNVTYNPFAALTTVARNRVYAWSSLAPTPRSVASDARTLSGV